MKRRILSALMAVVVTITSIPTGSFPVYAAESTEDVIMLEEELGETLTLNAEPLDVAAEDVSDSGSGDSSVEKSDNIENSEGGNVSGVENLSGDASIDGTADSSSDVEFEILSQEIVVEESIDEAVQLDADNAEEYDNGVASPEVSGGVTDSESTGGITDSESTTAAKALTLGTGQSACITEDGTKVLFSFTAIEAGRYYFYSASEKDVDPYASLYNSSKELLKSNDDKDDWHFGISYEMSAGETVLLEVGAYEACECTVWVEKDTNIYPTGISVPDYFRTVYVAEIDDYINTEESVILSYGDSIDDETIPMWGKDSHGNRITYDVMYNGQSGCSLSEPGSYTLRLECEDAVCEVPITLMAFDTYIQNTNYAAAIKNNQTVQKEGINKNQYYDYVFQAESDGYYSFAYSGNSAFIQIYSESGSVLDQSSAYSENSVLSIQAETGKSYMIRICQSESITKNSFTLGAASGKEVTALAVNEDIFTLVYDEMEYALNATISYSDKTTDKLVLYNKQTRDAYGNLITINIIDYDWKPGTYQGTVSCGSLTDTLSFQVISRLSSTAAASYPGLNLKKEDLASGAVTGETFVSDGRGYLKVTPDTTGDYTFELLTEDVYAVLYDKNEKNLGSKQVYLTAGETYLLVVQNAYETEEVTAQVSWTKNSVSITGITLDVPEQFYDADVMNNNSSISINYSDGTIETLESLLERTDDGRYLSVVLKSSSGEEYYLYDLGETKDYGNYTLSVSYGTVTATAQVEYTTREEMAEKLTVNVPLSVSAGSTDAVYTVEADGFYDIHMPVSSGNCYLNGEYQWFSFPRCQYLKKGDVLLFSVYLEEGNSGTIQVKTVEKIASDQKYQLTGLAASRNLYEFVPGESCEAVKFTADNASFVIYDQNGDSVACEGEILSLDSGNHYYIKLNPYISIDGTVMDTSFEAVSVIVLPLKDFTLDIPDPLYGNRCLNKIKITYHYEDETNTSETGYLNEDFSSCGYKATVKLYNSDGTLYTDGYDNIPAGDYTLSVTAGSVTKGNIPITIKTEMDVMPVLTTGSPMTDVPYQEWTYYKFTTDALDEDETGYGYCFSITGGSGEIRDKNDGYIGYIESSGMEASEENLTKCSFILEPSENYKVGLYRQWDCDVTVTVSKVPLISNLKAELKYEKFPEKISDLDQYDILISYQYSDGISSTVTGYGRDPYGYSIQSCYAQTESDDTFAAGKSYSAHARFAGKELEFAICPVTVSEAGIPAIKSNTTVTLALNEKKYLKFVPEATGQYKFSMNGRLQVFDGTTLEPIFEEDQYGTTILNMEKDKTYYLRAVNTYSGVEDHLLITAMETVTALDVLQCNSSVPEGVPYLPFAGMVLKASYENSQYKILYSDMNAVCDESGLAATAVVTKITELEDGTTTEELLTPETYEKGLEAGYSYKVTINYAGATTEFDLTVTEQTEEYLPELPEGQISLDTGRIHYYKINSAGIGYNVNFSISANQFIFDTATKDMTEGCYCGQNDWYLTAGNSYYVIVFFDPDDVLETSEAEWNVVEKLAVSSFTITDKQMKFDYGCRSFFDKVQLKAVYSDNSSYTWKLNESWYDQYGSYLECNVINKATGAVINYNELLDPGTYEVTFELEGKQASYEFTVESRDIYDLDMNTDSLVIEKGLSKMFKLKDITSERVIIIFDTALDYAVTYSNSETDPDSWLDYCPEEMEEQTTLWIKDLDNVGDLYLILTNNTDADITSSISIRECEEQQVFLNTESLTAEPQGWRTTEEYIQDISAVFAYGTNAPTSGHLSNERDENGYSYDLFRFENNSEWYEDIFNLTPGEYSYAVVQYWGNGYDVRLEPEFTVQVKSNSEMASQIDSETGTVQMTDVQANTWYLYAYTPNTTGSYTISFGDIPVELRYMSELDSCATDLSDEPAAAFSDVELTEGTTYYFRFCSQQTPTDGELSVSVIQSNLSMTAYIPGYDQSLTYNGTELTPEVVVQSMDESGLEGEKLIEGTHYTLTYSNNTSVTSEEKKATVTVTGIGSYASCEPITLEFEILPVNIETTSRVNMTCTYPEDGFTYNGAVQKPVVAVEFEQEIITDAGVEYKTILLEEGVDYEIIYTDGSNSFDDCVNAGTKRVHLNGIGNFQGEKYSQYEIQPMNMDNLDITLSSESYPYLPNGCFPKPTVKHVVSENNVLSLYEGTHYGLTYSNNNKVTIDNSKAGVTVTANDYSNYTGSKTLEFEIIGRKPDDLNITFTDENITYENGIPVFTETGMPVTPAIYVTVLDPDTKEYQEMELYMDYEVSYSNNYDPGTAQLIITPLDGAFTEPVTRDFVIAEAESLNVKNLTAESFYVDLYEIEEITAPAAGIQWYEWTPDAQESFLIDPDFDENITDTAKDAAFRIYQKDASTGNLYRVSSMLYPGDDYDTSILTAGTGASYYIRISSDADKVRIVKAAEISQDADCFGQGTASVFTGVSAWTLVPNESGTYSFYAQAGKTLQVYMIYENEFEIGYEPLDALVLTLVENAAAGEYDLTAGVTYLFIWNDANSEDTSRTLTAELTEPEIVKLEDNSTNEVYVPYGRTSVFELPAMTAGVRRYICGYDTDGAYVAGVTYSIGNLEDADSIVASVTGDSFAFVIPEGSETSETLYLTVTNNSESQDAVEALELGLVPEVSIAVDTSRLPYPVLEGWEDLAAELAVLEVTYGEDESAEYETDSFRIKDAADRFGYSWSVELDEESEIEHAYTVYTSWNGIKNESPDATFTVESVSADNVPVLARNYAEGGSFPGEISWESPSTFRFVPVVDGSYELALQKPAWIYLSADEEPELVYSRTIEVTKGTEVVLMIVPQYTDEDMCGYRLKRVSEAAPVYEISYTNEGSGYVFCGDYIEPEFDVVDSESGYVLEKGTDYTFNEYYNNYNAGYGLVYITGKGEYAALGQVGYSFQISKANLNDVTFPDSVAYEYTGNPITYDENGTVGSYTLYPWYYTVNAGEANTTDVADSITVTLEANESGNFTGTKTVTFSITQKAFTEADAKAIQYKDSVVYTGEPVNPIEQIVLNGKTLQENTDYTVSYAEDHTNAGESSLTITGKGNYKGSFTDSFYISPRTFDEADELLEIQPIQPQTYTSNALTPVPVIKYNGNILVNGTDFEVDYANNTEITTDDNLASVIITGKGNYDGTLTRDFAIVNETVESSEITAKPMQSGTVYEAADSETWYSITADEMDLVYLKLSGEYASNARIFQLTENGTIWDRLWLDPETYTVNEAEWLIPVEAGMALAVAVPENTAFEGRTATDLSENTPIQTAADQGGWNIYRVTADQTGVYGIFAEQAGEIQVLDETLNSVVSTANGNYTTTASDTDGIAAKYEYVYRMNLSGSSLSSDTVVIAIPSGSGSYELSYFPDIVSIEVVESENVNNTYRRLDSEFFEGISFKVTYEDNTTVNLVPGNLDGWGRSFEKHLLLVGGELTYPAGTALYEGDYKRIIRYTDRYQQEYGAKEISDSVITVLSMEDSYTENTFVSGVPMVLKTEQAGSTEIYVIDAQRDWKYLIEGTQAVAIQFVDEDGYFGEIISGSEFDLELEKGIYYLYIQADLQSEASEAEEAGVGDNVLEDDTVQGETGNESVENGNENTSVSVTVTEKPAPDQIRYVQAYPDVYAIGVSWGTATKIGTIYDLYRSPVNDAGEATEFELLTTITNRSTTYYRDADFTAEELDQEFAYYVVARDGKYVVSEPSEVVKCEPGTDNIAPVVKSLTPESGKRLNKTFTITSYATDNVAVDHMELYIRNSDTETWTLLNTFAGSSFSYALDTTNYPDGTYYVKAIAYDAVNNASAAFENKYQFDNTAPEKVQNVTSDCTSATITLHWSDVADQDLAYFLVEEKDSSNNWVKAGETSTTLGMNFTNLAPDVTHTYRVKAVDKLGNVGEPSEEISVTTLSDTTAPVISGLNPKEGRYKDSITFTVTGTDEYAIRKLEIQYSQDTAEEKVWTQLAVSEEFAEVQKVRSLTGTLDIQELNLTEGAVFLRGVAWDMAENQSEITAAAPFVEFTVDQTAPAAPTATATAGDGYIEIRWEQGAEEDLGYYEVYKRTTGEENSFALLKNGLNTVNWYDRDVEGGETYYYMVKVSDTAGNVSAASDIVSVVAVVDEEAPVIQSVNPSDGNTFAAVDAENIQISALVSDNRCLSEISIWYKYSETAEYTDNHKVTSSNINDYWYVATAEVPLGYEADGLTKTIEDGQSIYLKVTAKDTSGNEAEPIELTCIADKAAPEIKSAAAAFGAENREIRISWTGGQEADLLGYYVYRSVNDGSWEMVDSEKAVVLEDETVAADYQFVDNALSTSGGTYSYKIEALDQLGNTGSLVIEEFITVEALEEDMILTPPTADLQCENLMEIHAEYLFDASGSTGESEITSYTFDFGDGEAVSTTKSSFIHNYAKAGTYTVKVTVVDVNGCEGTCERVVTVREPSTLGNVEVTVVDYDGNPVANAPVYFDLGSSNQFVRNTDYSGKVTITAGVGTHSFGCYKDGYLPVQSEVLLLSGETVKAELAIKEEPLVTGEFEIHRMTLDEIVAAGIDVTDPENQYVAKVTVHMVYEEAEIDFDFNVNRIGGIWKPKPVKLKDRIVYPIFIPGPDPIGGGTGGGGGGIIGGGGGSTATVALLDIPVGVSILKEFFDVKLHILNHADSSFSLLDNDITLNVPSGLKIMQTNVSLPSNQVHIDEIKGGTQETLKWIIRGDEVGSYALTADFAGTLSTFNTRVEAQFEAEDPIEVYGLSKGRLTITIPEVIGIYGDDQKGLLDYTVSFANEGSVPMYLPKIWVRDSDEHYQTNYFKRNGEMETLANVTDYPQVLEAGEALELLCYMDAEGYELYELQDWYVQMYGGYGIQVDVNVLGYEHTDSSIVITDAMTDAILAGKEIYLNDNAYTTDGEGCIYPLAEDITGDTLEITAQYFLPYTVDKEKILGENGTHKVRLQVDDGKGEPFVESFYYRQTHADGEESLGAWKDGLLDALTVYEDSKEVYRLELKANWNGNEAGTYTIQQSYGGKLENDTGIFTDVQLNSAGFKTDRPFYVFVTDANGVSSAPIRTKITFQPKERNPLSLFGGSLELGSSLKVTIPEDFPLIGGDEIELDLDDFPLFVKAEGYEVQVGINMNVDNDDDWNMAKKYFSKMDESNDATKNALLADQLKKKTGATTKVKKFLGDSSLEVSLIGYATFTYTENGNFEVTGGSIAVSIDLNGAIKEQLIKPPVFFVLKFGTKVGAAGTVEKPIIESDLPFRFNLELYFAPYLKATAGVGIKDVIAVELTGGVETKITWNMTSDYTRVVGKADVVVKAYIGPFTFLEETLEEKEKVLYESSGAVSTTSLLYEEDSLDQASELYSGEDGESTELLYEQMLEMVYNTEYYSAAETSYDYQADWNAQFVTSQVESDDPDLAENEQLLQDNVYPDARQTILETDDTRMMIWLSQDSTRAAQNSTILVYSLYDEQNDSWSTPVPVVDDGTADLYPQAMVKEDTIYVIWQDTAKVLGEDETSLADLAANTQISTAYYHEEAGRFITIDAAGSESGESYSDPKIVAEGDTMYAVWIANSEQDLFGTTGTNSILAARMTEDGWSSPQTLESGLAMIAAYDAAVSEQGLRVAVSLDTDASIATSSDWEIYEYSWNADNTFGQQRITENSVEDASPYYTQENGRKVLYWNSDDQTTRMYLDDSSYSSETMDLAVGTGRKQVVTRNGMYLFWIGDSTVLKEANEIYCAAFEENTGTYGSPVAVTDSCRFITSFQALGNADGTIELVYQARPVIVLESTGTDDDYQVTYGNSRFYRQNVLPDADLAVYDNGNLQAGKIYPGATVEFDLTLTNEGMFPADGYLVQILDESGKAVATKNYTEILQPGETTELTIPYLLPLEFTGQTYTVRAVLAAGTESNTNNNSIDVEVSGKEILVQSVQAVRSGSNAICIVKAKNMGSVDLENIYLEVHESTPNGTLLDRVSVGDILYGGMATWTYTLDLTKLAAEGTTKIYFTAKEILVDDEGNETEGVSDRGVTAVYASTTEALEMEVFSSKAEESVINVTALIQNDAIVAQEEDVAAVVYSDTGVVIGYQKETLTVGAGRTLRHTFAVPVTELPENWTAEVIPMIPAESVTLYLEQDGEAAEITETPVVREEYTLQLSAVVAPDEAIDHAVTWNSSDEEIATVDENGLVTGVKAGTVTITATAADGYGAKAECVITVRTKHIWSDDDWTETTAPTCTEPAVETRECLDEDCTETESRTGRDALGHTGGTATCKSQAVCDVCQTSYGELGDHTGGKATCKSQAVCDVCQTSYGELGDHTGGEATCQNQAVCDVCQTPYGDLGDHRGGTATCQSKAVCSVCSQEYGELADHDYDTEWTVDVQETCTAAGSKSHHCKTEGCDSVKDSTSVPALGHTGGTATCTKQAVCTRCNTAYGSLKAHTGGTATCQSKAVCSVCGSSYGALGTHSFSTEWTIDVQPTCLAAGSKSHHCTVEGCTATTGSAEEPKLDGTIKLTATKLPLQLKKSANLKSIVTGLSEGDYIKGWKTSNSKIVTVNSSGKITGKKLGTATVTVTLASGASASVKVTVQKKAVATTKVTVESKKITLNKGKSVTLKPVLTPVTSLEKVTYKTSNKKVATVNAKGKITAKASGKAVITVKAGKKTVKVTVTVPKVQPTKITGVPASRNLKKGKTLTLKPKLYPRGAEATIKYSTSNKKVATVDKKGKIKAVGKGTATITVTAGKAKVQCKITVK